MTTGASDGRHFVPAFTKDNSESTGRSPLSRTNELADERIALKDERAILLAQIETRDQEIVALRAEVARLNAEISRNEQHQADLASLRACSKSIPRHEREG